jgi:hypothetical protein
VPLPFSESEIRLLEMQSFATRWRPFNRARNDGLPTVESERASDFQGGIFVLGWRRV